MLKLLAAVTASILLLVFIGFNLENKSDISFGFTVIHDIPVFLTILASFSLGLLASVPFLLARVNKKRTLKKNQNKIEHKGAEYPDTEPKKPARKLSGKSKVVQAQDNSDPHAGSYGVD